MIAGLETGLDLVGTWGDPWHGLIVGNTLALPSSVSRPVPGTSPIGGDCYVVQVPGQPAVTTPPADTALGMTWLNYGLLAGENHCIYGVALGAGSWIYIDGAGAAWLASMTFAVGTGAGAVTFRRFGILPSEGAIVQTAAFSVAGPFTGSSWMVDDIKSSGAGVLVVTYEPEEFWPGASAMATPGYRNVGGAFSLALSGVPPSVEVAAVQLANATQAGGEYVDTRVATHTTIGSLSIKISNVGRHGHSNKLFGYCYVAGVATPVLRSMWADQESYSTPVEVEGTFFVDYTTTGLGSHVYEIKIGAHILQVTGIEDWAGSGRIDRSFTPPSHLSGHMDIFGAVGGYAGFTYEFEGDAAASFQANDSLIFTEAGGTDNYMVWIAGPSNPTMAIWPKRLGNGLFGVCRFQYDFTAAQFGGTHLTGIIGAAGVVVANLSSMDDGAVARGSRHPVTGDVHYQLTADGSNVCWR